MKRFALLLVGIVCCYGSEATSFSQLGLPPVEDQAAAAVDEYEIRQNPNKIICWFEDGHRTIAFLLIEVSIICFLIWPLLFTFPGFLGLLVDLSWVLQAAHLLFFVENKRKNTTHF